MHNRLKLQFWQLLCPTPQKTGSGKSGDPVASGCHGRNSFPSSCKAGNGSRWVTRWTWHIGPLAENVYSSTFSSRTKKTRFNRNTESQCKQHKVLSFSCQQPAMQFTCLSPRGGWHIIKTLFKNFYYYLFLKTPTTSWIIIPEYQSLLRDWTCYKAFEEKTKLDCYTEAGRTVGELNRTTQIRRKKRNG